MLHEITVKQLIEKLQTMDQNTIVCGFQADESKYYSLEMIKEIKDVHFIDDGGDEQFGNIVIIY